MRKGLFWVVGDGLERVLITYSVECDEQGRRLEKTPAYNSRKGNSFAHKASWTEAAREEPAKIRNKSWDYYPRGRVEIKEGAATIYFNPVLHEWEDFTERIILSFGLQDVQVTMNPDYSVHYQARCSD